MSSITFWKLLNASLFLWQLPNSLWWRLLAVYDLNFWNFYQPILFVLVFNISLSVLINLQLLIAVIMAWHDIKYCHVYVHITSCLSRHYLVPPTRSYFSMQFALPHLMGWDRLTNQLPVASNRSSSKVNTESLELEWDRWTQCRHFS